MERKTHTRLDKAAIALLTHPQGISGREIDFKYHINSGRNEVADLERIHGIKITREKAPTEGGGYYFIYALADREQAYKAIKVVNMERLKYQQPILTAEETHQYLSQFKGEI